MGHFVASLIQGVLTHSTALLNGTTERTQLFAGGRTLKEGSSSGNTVRPGFMGDTELVRTGDRLLITVPHTSASLSLQKGRQAIHKAPAKWQVTRVEKAHKNNGVVWLYTTV